MDRKQTPFIKQSITATKNWDDYQLLLRRCRMLLGNGRQRSIPVKK